MVIDERVDVHESDLVIQRLKSFVTSAIIAVLGTHLRLNHVLILALVLLASLLSLLTDAALRLVRVLSRQIRRAQVLLLRFIFPADAAQLLGGDTPLQQSGHDLLLVDSFFLLLLHILNYLLISHRLSERRQCTHEKSEDEYQFLDGRNLHVDLLY